MSPAVRVGVHMLTPPGCPQQGRCSQPNHQVLVRAPHHQDPRAQNPLHQHRSSRLEDSRQPQERAGSPKHDSSKAQSIQDRGHRPRLHHWLRMVLLQENWRGQWCQDRRRATRVSRVLQASLHSQHKGRCRRARREHLYRASC